MTRMGSMKQHRKGCSEVEVRFLGAGSVSVHSSVVDVEVDDLENLHDNSAASTLGLAYVAVVSSVDVAVLDCRCVVVAHDSAVCSGYSDSCDLAVAAAGHDCVADAIDGWNCSDHYFVVVCQAVGGFQMCYTAP